MRIANIFLMLLWIAVFVLVACGFTPQRWVMLVWIGSLAFYALIGAIKGE